MSIPKTLRRRSRQDALHKAPPKNEAHYNLMLVINLINIKCL
nr:MAG TPA: hypothetical protein [Caudoviricetes sp.]